MGFFSAIGDFFSGVVDAISNLAGAVVGAAMGFLQGGPVGAVIGGVLGLLGTSKKPQQKAGFTAQAQDRQHVVRSAVATRTIVYGEAMVSGPLAFVAASGTNNKYLHLIIPLAGHEVDGIGTVYFNDRPEWEVVGRSRTEVKFYQSDFFGLRLTVNGITHTTDTGGVADLEAVIVNAPGYAAGSYSVARKGHTLIFTGSKQVSVTHASGRIHAGAPWSETLGGRVTTNLTGLFNNLSTIANNRIADVKQTAPATEYARIKRYLGSPYQSADPDLVADVPEWTSAHRLRGIAYIYVRLVWDKTYWASGIPNIKAIVRGKKVYDPRSGRTGHSSNWALCLRDYIASSEGLDAAAEIDEQAAIAAANVADEIVTGPPGQSSVRYTCNGVVSLDTPPYETLQHLASAGAGAVVWSQGKYRIHAGVYTAPEVLLTEDDLRGALSVRTRLPRREVFNGVRGTYVDPGKGWQPTDFPIVKSDVFAAEDGGEEILQDIQLPFTTSPRTAQQIAKMTLERSRQAILVEFPGKYTVLPIGVWDTVMLSISSLGWDAKPFRVVAWRFSVDGGVDLTLQEESEAAYEWNDGDIREVDTAPNTNLPSPFIVPAPTGLTVVPAGLTDMTEIPGAFDDDPLTIVVNGDIRLEWQPADVFAAQYAIMHQHLLVEVVRDHPRTVRVVQAGVVSETLTADLQASIAASTLETGPVPEHPADLHLINLFAVAAVNGIGARSAWSEVLFVEFAPPVIPPRVTGLELDLGGEYGGGSGTEWGGRDVKIKWRRSAATAGDVGASPFGGGDGGADAHFKDYQIRVFDVAGRLLREDYGTDTSYTYTYEKNAEDFQAINGSAGANRTLQFEVRSRGRQNQLSEPATL